MCLNQKVVIITGAAGAIGSATAHAMAEQGASLVLVDRDAQALERATQAISERSCIRLAADVTRAADNARVAEQAVARFGGIDVFFANAGIEGEVVDMLSYPQDSYERVMDVNVKGVLLGLQSIVPLMREGGSVVMTSSVMGLAGAARNIAYTASKHAVVGLMRSAALEGAARGIRVNSVHPGFVDSPMLRRLIQQHPEPAAFEQRMLARTKLRRFVLPQDIAQAVIFLASDNARMITSQTLVIDGGMLD